MPSNNHLINAIQQLNKFEIFLIKNSSSLPKYLKKFNLFRRMLYRRKKLIASSAFGEEPSKRAANVECFPDKFATFFHCTG